MSAAERLHAIADEYWQTRLEAGPIMASFLGDHRYDDRSDDMSAEHEQQMRARWLEFRNRVADVPDGELGETDRISRTLLIDELDDATRMIDIRATELASDQTRGVHSALMQVAGQLRAPEVQHARMAVDRARAMAATLDQGADRYREGLRAGRTPVEINVARSISQLEKYLASPLESDPFVNLTGPDGWEGTDAWRTQMLDAVRDTLRPAFGRYLRAYSNDLLPAARSNDRPGICHLDGGDELYQMMIKHHTGLDLTADELHRIGLEEATVTIRAEFAEVGSRVFGTTDVPEIFERMRTDSALRYAGGDEILEHARQCLERAEAAIADWFGILPEADCVLEPVPDYLAADVPPAYYLPPAPDGSRPGTYAVNLHEPTERSRYATASIAFHEAVPGHHLQIAIATERTDLPTFRRMSWGHTAFVEGWALYTERLADEMGLYTDDVDRLGMLSSDVWRACRLVVDTGMHAMGWTRQQAIDFMVEHMPVDLDTITVDIDRYIGWPGQALAYKVGQREILRLKVAAQDSLGARFDIRSFHDAVLGAATVSLPILRGRVEDYLRSV